MTQPAEHCGHQPDHAIGQLTECVLRPGHSGSHANHDGMRWWLATLPDETAQPRHTADSITDDGLDRLYAELDTLRAVARSNLQHVRAIVPELEKAEAALNAVRALAERWQHTTDRKHGPLRELRAALDTHTNPS